MVNRRPDKRRVTTGPGPAGRRVVAPSRRTTESIDEDDYVSRHKPWVRAIVWIVVAAMVLSGVSVLLAIILG
jgi:hypothetical protein